MIAKYAGTCTYCGKPTKPGDEYDSDTKKSFHVECEENQPPTAEQLALSQRLHFMSFDAAMHVKWSELRGEGQRTLWAREE